MRPPFLIPGSPNRGLISEVVFCHALAMLASRLSSAHGIRPRYAAGRHGEPAEVPWHWTFPGEGPSPHGMGPKSNCRYLNHNRTLQL